MPLGLFSGFTGTTHSKAIFTYHMPLGRSRNQKPNGAQRPLVYGVDSNLLAKDINKNKDVPTDDSEKTEKQYWYTIMTRHQDTGQYNKITLIKKVHYMKVFK
jgi:hypothetical protein